MINTQKNIVWWNNAFFSTTLYGVMTDSSCVLISDTYLRMVHLTKRLAWSSSIWRLLHTCQNHQVPVHRLLSAAQSAPPLMKVKNFQDFNLILMWKSFFWNMNRLTQGCSIFHPVGQTSLIPSGKSLSQQSFRLLDSSLSTDSLIFTTITYAV